MRFGQPINNPDNVLIELIARSNLSHYPITYESIKSFTAIKHFKFVSGNFKSC